MSPDMAAAPLTLLHPPWPPPAPVPPPPPASADCRLANAFAAADEEYVDVITFMLGAC